MRTNKFLLEATSFVPIGKMRGLVRAVAFTIYGVSHSKEGKVFLSGEDIDFDFCLCFVLYVLMR